MTETTLAAAVRELVAALNGGDADTARAWCTEQAWERGPLPLEPMCMDEHLLLEVAPDMLETDQRAAARLVGSRGDNSRESLWLLFEAREDGWSCIESCRTQLDAENFLTNNLDPQALGVDKMSKEELEKLLPQVIGSAFGALFATAFKGLLDGLEQAPPAEGTVDRERARRAGVPVPETPFEKELSRMVSGALRDAVKPAVRNGSARIDTDFLAQTGPQLLGSLFGAVAKAVVPANVKVDVPAPEGSSEEPVKVEIPLGDLLGQLFGAAAASAKPAQAPNAPADDEEPSANEEEPPADDDKGPEK